MIFDTIARSASFDPKSIPGLALWLDAADLGSISLNSGVVQQWNDKSGNERHVSQSTAANRPGFTAGDGITFTSSAHQLTNATSNNVLANLTAFVAFRCTETGSYATIAGNDTFVRFGGWTVLTVSTVTWGRYGCGKTAVANRVFSAITQIKTTDRVFRVAATDAEIRARVIGATTQNGTATAMTTGSGSTPAVGTFPRGNMVIREILVYSLGLSDINIQQIETYLQSKWKY